MILKWGQLLLPGEMCGVSAVVMMMEKAYYCDANVLQCSRQTHTIENCPAKKASSVPVEKCEVKLKLRNTEKP